VANNEEIHYYAVQDFLKWITGIFNVSDLTFPLVKCINKGLFQGKTTV
jgi:hypothetical protein